MDLNNSLIKKIVKHKKLYKTSSSLIFIMPKSWLVAMNWSRETNFLMEIHPLRKEIIITENEKISNTQPSEHN